MPKIGWGSAYILFSNLAVLICVVDAALTFQQFFSTVVFLTSSKAFSVMVANLVAANLLLLGRVVRRFFFGALSPAENQRINEEFFVQVFEFAVGLAYFQGVLTSWLVIAFVMVGGFKMFHLLAVSRLESIERSIARPTGLIRRLTTFLLVSSVIDVYFLVNCAAHVYERGVNIYLMLLLNFSTMLLTALVTQVKLVLYLQDEGEGRGPARFYIEIVSSIVESVLYVSFFAAMTRVALPLHMIRDLLRSLRHLLTTIRTFAKYRRLATNIDRTFADASHDDLERDRRCAVCYDDMLDDTNCKRLPCGHCYHRHCLRKWFEKNSSCPYCRKEVEDALAAPPPRPAAPPGVRAAVPPAPHDPQAVVRQRAEGHAVDAAAAVPQQVFGAPTTPDVAVVDASAGPRGEEPNSQRNSVAHAAGGPQSNETPVAEDAAPAVNDAMIAEAYQLYVQMHQTMRHGNSRTAAEASVARSTSAAATLDFDKEPAASIPELSSDVLVLRAQIHAFMQYRREVEEAARRLDERLVMAEIRGLLRH